MFTVFIVTFLYRFIRAVGLGRIKICDTYLLGGSLVSRDFDELFGLKLTTIVSIAYK